MPNLSRDIAAKRRVMENAVLFNPRQWLVIRRGDERSQARLEAPAGQREKGGRVVMLIAHKIELRPTPEQAEYLNRACGSRRHCYNQLLAHVSQPDVTWSKATAYQHDMTVLRIELLWYSEQQFSFWRHPLS